jgi:glycosyltransferase involved in cell wall biosynthesis
MAVISGDPCSALVFMDADGQHDPGQLEEFVSPVLARTADMVVGSRYLLDAGRGNTPWNRYLVRRSIQAALGLLLTTTVADPFSGYRCLGPDAARCVELTGDRYESELEMLFCADRHAFTVAEVAIPKVYGQRTSKMGVRHGSIIGRIDVVSRYVLTMIRESIRSRSTTVPKEGVPA